MMPRHDLALGLCERVKMRDEDSIQVFTAGEHSFVEKVLISSETLSSLKSNTQNTERSCLKIF